MKSKGGFVLSKKLYDGFLAAYEELDALCAEYFGIQSEGVAEYINRLGEAKGGARKAQMLSHLVRYRAIRNEIERQIENGSRTKRGKIKSGDVIRIKTFIKSIEAKRDPLSVSLRQEKNSNKPSQHRLLTVILPIVLVLLIAGIVTALCFILINQ